MLATTQQLVSRRALGALRALTATHDNNTAWSGLVSSLLTLWRQRKVRANVGGALIAAIYLAGISGLTVTTPALFVFEAFNTSIIVNTTGSPDWYNAETSKYTCVES